MHKQDGVLAFLVVLFLVVVWGGGLYREGFFNRSPVHLDDAKIHSWAWNAQNGLMFADGPHRFKVWAWNVQWGRSPQEVKK